MRFLPIPLVLAACGAPAPEPEIPWASDGAPPIAAPAAPAAVLPPSRTCPAGWTEDPLDYGGHACRPFAAVPDCDVTDAQFPGEVACAPIGAECPAGDWPTDVTDAIFVAAGGTGDGTRTAPFGALADAVAAAETGDTIVVGAGTFEAGITLDKEVTLRGLCPSRTTLTLTDGDAVVSTKAVPVTIRDLRISGTDAVGVDARGGAATLTGVVIDDVGTHGVYGAGVALTLNDVRISAVRPKADQTLGRGVTLGRGSLTASRLQVDASHQAAVWVESDKETSVLVEDFVVYGMTPQLSDNNRGVALRGYGASGDVTVRRAFVAGGNDYAIATATPGNTTLEDVWVQDVGADLYDGGAFGGVGNQGGGLVTRGVTVQGCPGTAVRYQNFAEAEASFVSEDVVTTRSRVGLSVYTTNPNMAIARTVLIDHLDVAADLYVDGAGVASLTDLRLRGNADGLTLRGNAAYAIARLAADDNGGAAVTSTGPDFSLEDATIRAPFAEGAGVLASGAAVTMSRVAITDVALAGISLTPGNGGSTLEDVTISNVIADPDAGFGLGINSDGALTLSRVAVAGAAGGGVSAYDGVVVAEDVSVSAITADTLGRGGFALDFDNSTADLARVRVDGAAGGLDCDACIVTGADLAIADVPSAGVRIGPFGGATLERLLVEGCGTGLRAEGAITVYDGLLRDNDVAVDAEGGWYGGQRVTGAP